MIRIFYYPLFILLFLPTLSVAGGGVEGERRAKVEVGSVSVQSIAPKAIYLGTVIGRDDATLAARVNGYIDEIFEVGDEVQTGDVVVQIDDTSLLLQLHSAQAELEPIRAQLEFYKKESERLSILADRGHTPVSNLDEHLAHRDELAGKLEVAKAKISELEDNLIHTSILSPFSGVVVERLKNHGEYAAIGELLLRVVNTQMLEVVVHIPSHLLSYVSNPGVEFLVTNDADKTTNARLLRLIPVADNLSRLYELRLDLLNKEGWVIGQAVRVSIPTSNAHQALFVPQDALLIRREGISIFRVLSDHTVELIPIQTGTTQGDQIEVIGEINVGDTIITRGNELLSPGQRITIQ